LDTVKSFFKRYFPAPRAWWIFTVVLLRVVLVLVILLLFRILFFTSCLSIGNVKECTASGVDNSGTLFALGGILISILTIVPIFWSDRRIEDAKKDISRQVLEGIQEKMKDLNKAQILAFEAERLVLSVDLGQRELIVNEVIRLWPSFQPEEHRKLGRCFSEAVMNQFYHGAGREIDFQGQMQGLTLNRDQIKSYINKAIFYLEETVLGSDPSDRADLVNLACMYGCATRYDEMIRTVERAIRADENAKDDFQEAKRLSLLIYACGPNGRNLEKLGKKIGKELPLSKSEFARIVRKVDLQRRTNYINFFAVSKQPVMLGEYIYYLKITATDTQGQRSVNALYITITGGKDGHDIPSQSGQQITIEELFDEVDKELFIICFEED